jgi:UDP-glucose 4-epimerase
VTLTDERILITGGNGYVGRQLTRRLYDRHEVCVVDNLRYGQNRFSAEDLAKIRFEAIDIADAAAVAAVVEAFGPDVIVHLAAVHYIPECERDPWNALRTNLMGLVSLLLAAPENSRFVYASSGAVYKPDDCPHREAKAALEPSDIYGLTKLHGEHYVRYLAQKRSLAAVIVRLFNVVGPGETNPHLLPEIVARLHPCRGCRARLRHGRDRAPS